MNAYPLFAQTEHDYLLEGTIAFENQDFSIAESNFTKAASKNKNSIKASYNLGNAYFRQNKFEQAIASYMKSIQMSENNQMKASIHYNIGNAHLSIAKKNLSLKSELANENILNAINAYKASLKLNPSDYDAKNNLSKAYKLLKNQNQSSQNSNTPPPPSPKKDQKIQNGQKSTINNDENLKKDEIDRLMDIIDQEDKRVQQKLMKSNKKTLKKIEKDW